LGLTVVESLELCRGDIAVVVDDLAMQAPVVEPVDVAQGGELNIVEPLPWSLAVDELPFVKAVEGFGEGIVIALTG